jgi:hypothetical protein
MVVSFIELHVLYSFVKSKIFVSLSAVRHTSHTIPFTCGAALIF